MDWKAKCHEQTQQLNEVVPALHDLQRLLESDRDQLDRKISGLGGLIGRISAQAIGVAEPTQPVTDKALPSAPADMPPKRRGRKPKSAAIDTESASQRDESGPGKRINDKRLAIARILELDGPLKPVEISKRLGLHKNSTAVYSFLRSDWFTKSDAGYDLLEVARQSLDELAQQVA